MPWTEASSAANVAADANSVHVCASAAADTAPDNDTKAGNSDADADAAPSAMHTIEKSTANTHDGRTTHGCRYNRGEVMARLLVCYEQARPREVSNGYTHPPTPDPTSACRDTSFFFFASSLQILLVSGGACVCPALYNGRVGE